MTIEEAGKALRAGRVSAVELAQESLASIRAGQHLNAFITITEELALEQARRADEELARGFDRGPLHGIPYALKDLFATRGIPTTCGSKIFAHRITDHDSAAFRQLTEAGAVLMGKAGLHEFAYGITSNNPHFGAIRNPHDPDRIAGGSSGGSGAAVAAGMVFFSMGTDTGGSIRVPASYCGCVGLKPTYGRVSREGVFPLGFSLDHVGPLTRTVRDAEIVMQTIAGFQPTIRPIAGLRIGVPENFFTERLAPAVEASFHEALRTAEAMGARLVPITVPDPEAVNAVGRIILLAEAAAALKPWSGRREDFGADVLSLLDQGRMVSGVDYIDAQRLRKVYQKKWSSLWIRIDVLFSPATAIEAPFVGQETVTLGDDQEDVRLASTRLVRPFNVLGLPAISLPLTTGALPVGLQIAGRAYTDEEVLGISAGLNFCKGTN